MNFKILTSIIMVASLSTSATSFATKNPKNNTQGAKKQIGFLAAVSGDVKVDNKAAKSGDLVFLPSTIETGDQGKLQVLIGDGMVALLGYNTTVNIEKYGKIKPKKTKEKKSIKQLTEFAQVELKKGSLRLLVKRDEQNPRQGKVRAGKEFALVNHGEAVFACDEACAKKSSAAKKSIK